MIYCKHTSLWHTCFIITLILGFTEWAAAPKRDKDVIFCECAQCICFGVHSFWFKYLCVYIALEIFSQLWRHSPNTF